MAFADWSTNPANNSLVGGITWSNGMLPSQVDDSARQMMADLATWGLTVMLKTGGAFTGAVSFGSGITGPVTFSGAIGAQSLSTTGSLGVGGAATFNGLASFPAGITGPVTFSSSVGAASLSTSGAAGVGTTLSVGGTGTFGGNVTVPSVQFAGTGNPKFVPSGSNLLIQISGVTVAYFDATGVHNGAP